MRCAALEPTLRRAYPYRACSDPSATLNRVRVASLGAPAHIFHRLYDLHTNTPGNGGGGSRRRRGRAGGLATGMRWVYAGKSSETAGKLLPAPRVRCRAAIFTATGAPGVFVALKGAQARRLRVACRLRTVSSCRRVLERQPYRRPPVWRAVVRPARYFFVCSRVAVAWLAVTLVAAEAAPASTSNASQPRQRGQAAHHRHEGVEINRLGHMQIETRIDSRRDVPL